MKLASKFKSMKQKTLVRWFVAYSTSLPALFVLSLGIAGLISCLCQYIVLQTIQKEAPKLAQEVGDFANNVVSAVNNASESWALGANQVINTTNTKINQDIFGWVETSTSAVNNTLNEFVNGINGVLNVTFGGTILYGPIQGVMNCLVELKIQGIQKGITWVHDHAHIDLPEFRPDVFSLGAAASITNSTADDNFLADPSSTTGDEITSAVVKVADKLRDSIRTEVFISLALIGVFFLNMLIGLIWVIYSMAKRDKTRGEGGAFTGDNRAPLSPRTPNRNNSAMFPQFNGPVSSVSNPSDDSDKNPFNDGDVANERLGTVGQPKPVESQSGHQRVSSYGYLDEKTRW
jgi:hypothetical protein